MGKTMASMTAIRISEMIIPPLDEFLSLDCLLVNDAAVISAFYGCSVDVLLTGGSREVDSPSS